MSSVWRMEAFVIVGYFAIVLHEIAHAYMAELCGDPTPRAFKRVTLNPARHIDLVGTVIVPAVMMAAIGMPLGWAKPVPVNFMWLRRIDRVRVALAGPLCNLVQCGAFSALFLVVHFMDGPEWLLYFAVTGMEVNGLLAGINLLPLLPLDGGRVVHSLLPPRWAYHMAKWEGVQMIVLGVLLGVTAYWWRQ